jgi:hypothetical protein
MHGVLGEPGIERLPGIGERALAEMRLETCGDISGLHSVGQHHAYLGCCVASRIEREECDGCTAYKVLNVLAAPV